MKLERLDHFVLTVQNLEATVAFYESVLGMRQALFGKGRVALKYGQQKINLHVVGHEFEPKAAVPTPGAADLCFLTSTPLAEAMNHVRACGVEIIEGPVQRTGANGPLLSFYFRDPDQNLLEVSNEC
ncbi:MAG: VOC family protein [Anaerolineales bacterium]|nr:VOC family protein [Anaerolineales bacterium]